MHFSQWKQFVLSGGLDHNKGKKNLCQIPVFKDVYAFYGIPACCKVLEKICNIQGVLMGFLEVWEPCMMDCNASY